MKRVSCAIASLLVLTFLWSRGPVMAEEGLHDKVTAYAHAGVDERHVVVDLWMANVNPVIGITLPFKFAAKGDSLSFDSLSLAGGRAEHFKLAKPLFRPENQSLVINMLWKLDTASTAPAIPPGKGSLMRLYLSATAKLDLKDFNMASVQIPPSNTLLYVTETLNPVNPDFGFTRGEAPKASPKEPAGEQKEKAQKKSP